MGWVVGRHPVGGHGDVLKVRKRHARRAAAAKAASQDGHMRVLQARPLNNESLSIGWRSYRVYPSDMLLWGMKLSRLLSRHMHGCDLRPGVGFEGQGRPALWPHNILSVASY
eukprot:scaffold3775_cov29-Prasinocladus_malaysianus.AAC.3